MNKRLLYSAVLAAALSSSVQAQVAAPEFKGQPVQLKLDGTDTVYIYNVKAQKWLTKGNSYGTETAVDSLGKSLKFAITSNGDGTFTMNDEYTSGNWKKMFVASASETGGGSYVDYNNQGLWRTKWVVRPNGNTFQLQVDTIAKDLNTTSETDDRMTIQNLGETRFAFKANEEGINSSSGSFTGQGVVRPTVPLDSINTFPSDYGADWQAYSVDDVEKYQVRFNELMPAINKAVEAGADVSAQIAIYNNENATLAELQAAVKAANYAVRNKVLAEATIDNPADLGQFLSGLDCTSTSAWTTEGTFDSDGNVGSGGNGTKWQKKPSTPNPAADGTELSSALERWINSSSDKETGGTVTNAGKLSDSKIYQVIEGLPAGGYRISGYFHATHQGRGEGGTGTYFFANNKQVEVATDEEAAVKKQIICVVGEDGKLTFGYKTENTTNNWVYMAKISAEYFGNDATTMLVMDMQTVADEASEYVSGASINETYVDAVNAAVAAAEEIVNNTSKQTEENIAAAKTAIENALADAQANETAYNKLAELEQTINDYSGDLDPEDFPAMDDLLDAYDQGVEGQWESFSDINETKPYTTEKVNEYIAFMNDLIEKALKSGIQPGKEIPSTLLADPSFENNGAGWSGKETVNSTYQNCEAYMKTFNMYQELVDVPDGVYTISAQAFQRVGYNDAASGLYEAGEENITTYLYGNEIKKKVASPYSELMAEAYDSGDYSYNGGYVPNSMHGFQGACDQGLYNNEISVLVTSGTLRFGIKCEQARQDGYWSIWDNFKVKYDGTDAEAYAKVMDQILVDANEALAKKMSADSLNALNEAISAVKANPGMETILALNNAVAAAQNSAAAYETLNSTISDITSRYEAADQRSAEAVATFNAALATAQSAYDNGTTKDSEVPSVIYDLKKAFTTYLVSDDAKLATMSNPVDVTYVISNADFASNDQTGWSGTAGAFQTGLNEMEYYSKVFDFYQEIPGMPAGRYELTVQAFHRQGFVAAMKDSVDKGTLKEPAVIYLNDITTPIVSLSKGATTATAGQSNYVAYDEEAGTYVPNTMTTALAEFSDESRGAVYLTTLSHYVAETTDLKIGAKKETNISGDWTIFNNFTLKYLGNGTDGIEAINGKSEAGVLGTQVYNVNGVATGKLQKGINIVKTTLSDGTVKVSKVIVK